MERIIPEFAKQLRSFLHTFMRSVTGLTTWNWQPFNYMYLREKPLFLQEAVEYGRFEPVTPWMGADSARHYQWYPFINLGHYHLASVSDSRISKEFGRNLRSGIERVYERAQGNPI